MSKYEQIYKELLQKIKTEEILANTYLPSENELMKTYHASRDTIRKSLSMLLQNNYIVKEKGKGSRVLDRAIISFPVSGVTSFKELQKSIHGNVETIVETVLKIAVDDMLKQALFMEEGEVFKVVRIRKIDNEKVILDTDYINASIVSNLTVEIAQNSLYEYIEGELGLKISFARKEITVKPATSEEKKLLDMQDYDVLVVVESYTYLEDATLFQYSISKHRPDKFRFVDFAKRSKFVS